MSYTFELNNERKDANFVSGKINGKSAIVEIFSAMRDGKDLAPYGKKAEVSVVLPWSMWPMVPTLTWGLSLIKCCFAIWIILLS